MPHATCFKAPALQVVARYCDTPLMQHSCEVLQTTSHTNHFRDYATAALCAQSNFAELSYLSAFAHELNLLMHTHMYVCVYLHNLHFMTETVGSGCCCCLAKKIFMSTLTWRSRYVCTLAKETNRNRHRRRRLCAAERPVWPTKCRNLEKLQNFSVNFLFICVCYGAW